MYKSLLSLAYEELAEGSKNEQEDEFVFYGEIGELNLDKAISKESHEQWEIKPDGEAKKRGRFRVRKTTVEGQEPVYDMTIKLKIQSSTMSSNQELTHLISAEDFQAFKLIANSGMIKDRYIFDGYTVPQSPDGEVRERRTVNFQWEVDLFPDGNGGYYPWCKIDCEIAGIKEQMAGSPDMIVKINPRQIPFTFKDIIDGHDKSKSNLVTELYDKYFLSEPERT